MPTPVVIRDFARSSAHLPEIEPDVIETLVDFKDSHLGDPDPTRWRVDVLRELLLEVLPRKVSAPEDWFAAVVPTTRAYLEFLASKKRLARGSDPAARLLATVDSIGDGVVAASRDPRTFGMAKAIFSAVRLDPSAADPARAAMEAFNALPDEQRAAILDPAMRRLDVSNVLALSSWDDDPFVGDPFVDDPFVDDPFDDDETWPSLPLIWLPPDDELAAAARSAPLVGSLLRLADWNGTGHKVTRQGVLPLAAARRACADLGLPLPRTAVRSAERIPALQRLWSLAVDSDILEIDEGSAVRGEAADLLTDPGQDPNAVVAWWAELFAACIDWGLDTAEDPDLDDEPDDEILDTADGILATTLTELYPGTAVPASGLEDIVTAAVEQTYVAFAGPFGPSAHDASVQVRARWAAHMTQLLELGAVELDEDIVSLTPLGRAGVRALALADDAEAPLVDDPATLDATTLLDHLPLLGTPIVEPLLAAWSATRSPEQATEELFRAARTGTARTRITAVAVLMEFFGEHLTGAGRPRLEELRDDPVLGLSAHVLLAGPEQSPALPPDLKQWAALEAVAVFLDAVAVPGKSDPGYPGADILDEETTATVWAMVDSDADLDSAWRSTHPQLVEVLEAIATRHPRGRSRKAAKKALFKARQSQGSR